MSFRQTCRIADSERVIFCVPNGNISSGRAGGGGCGGGGGGKKRYGRANIICGYVQNLSFI